jgi:ribosomal protein S8
MLISSQSINKHGCHGQFLFLIGRRRLKCEKLTDDGCQVMAKTKNQQKIENYIKEFGFIFDFLFFSHFTEKKNQHNLQHHQNNYGKIKLFAI